MPANGVDTTEGIFLLHAHHLRPHLHVGYSQLVSTRMSKEKCQKGLNIWRELEAEAINVMSPLRADSTGQYRRPEAALSADPSCGRASGTETDESPLTNVQATKFQAPQNLQGHPSPSKPFQASKPRAMDV